MPRLKQIQVQGFKSFADPLTLLFPTGVTAVVGPNGSGKSNISDAIRWVLGEQRMTSLRGRVGEDMIFAGSKKRARAGMSRVMLTFDNSEQWLPLDFAEVTIERCTYRDGKTDYLLNGSKVRLGDLRDVLDRAGLGRDAYLFIGQGLVDQVLSLRPKERMAIFEQASGIAPYRNRREDAVKQLEETQHNLERVGDIISEIEPRLRRLKRQAERAEQHAQIDTVLKELLTTWYGYRWGRALTNFESIRQRVAYREEQAFNRLDAVESLEKEGAALRAQSTALRAQLTKAQQEFARRRAAAESLQRDLAVTLERQRSLTERREEARADIRPLQQSLEASQADVADLESALTEAEARLTQGREALSEAQKLHQEAAQRRQRVVRRQREAQARVLDARRQLADRQSRLEQLADRVTQLDERAVSLRAELDTADERRRTQEDAVSQAQRALAKAETACVALEAEEETLRERHEAARGEVERLRRELATQQAEHQRLSARLDALERLHSEGAGLYAGVRAVLQATERGQLDVIGTVASLIRVPSTLDRAIEVALGSQLQHIVVEEWEHARVAIAWLKQRRAGRATFLPLDTLRPRSPLTLPKTARTLSGVLGVAVDLIDYDPQVRPAVLSLLGRTVVVEGLDSAHALYRQMRGGFQIVTVEGEILRSSGSVTGGESHKQQKGSLLARERERRVLPEKVDALTQTVQTLHSDLDDAEAAVQDLSRALQDRVARSRAARQRRQECERALDRASGALDNVAQEVAWQRKLLAESTQEHERLTQDREQLLRAQEQAAQDLKAAEADLDAVEQELAAFEDDDTARVAAERRTQVALLEQARENALVLLKTRQREMARVVNQITTQERHVHALGESLTDVQKEVETLRARCDDAAAASDTSAERIPALEAQLSALESRATECEQEGVEARRALREAEQRLSQAEVDASRREDQVQALRREIEEALGIVVGDLPESLLAQQPLPLQAIVSPLPKVDVLPEGLEQQIRDLRTQLRRLEPVNPSASAEYEEVAERHRFLSEQKHDLEVASTNLRQVIAELDEMMDKTFRITFQAIASEFSRIFKLLFNGGTARLDLQTDEGEITGVDIMARPPGKRTSGLGMLSGGERTLTAVALLFAVLQISPIPFCVLDEVDAMLDEANVGRFRTMLRDLSRETQFVVITHNRGTVEAADTIYGVSMGDDGVSQMLSLSLEDLPPSE